MSATIVPFTGEWQGRDETRPSKMTAKARAAGRAFHDARLIRNAKDANDDWTARLLLALLQRLPSKQLDLLEFDLIGPNGIDSKSACQALALVQLAKGDKPHRERVKNALAELEKREAE